MSLWCLPLPRQRRRRRQPPPPPPAAASMFAEMAPPQRRGIRTRCAAQRASAGYAAREGAELHATKHICVAQRRNAKPAVAATQPRPCRTVAYATSPPPASNVPRRTPCRRCFYMLRRCARARTPPPWKSSAVAAGVKMRHRVKRRCRCLQQRSEESRRGERRRSALLFAWRSRRRRAARATA